MNFGPSITLVNCQLVGNRALMQGGGLYNYEGAATLTNCRIVGNAADYADITGGAALYNLNGSLTVLDSTIADNRTPIGRAIASFTLGNGLRRQGEGRQQHPVQRWRRGMEQCPHFD